MGSTVSHMRVVSLCGVDVHLKQFVTDEKNKQAYWAVLKNKEETHTKNRADVCACGARNADGGICSN